MAGEIVNYEATIFSCLIHMRDHAMVLTRVVSHSYEHYQFHQNIFT